MNGPRERIRSGLASALLALAAAGPAPGQSEAAHPCAGELYDLARPFVGIWEEYTVTPDGEELAGTLRSSLEVDGCALVQRFESADDGFTFMSFGHVDPGTQLWHETFVLSNGRVASYRWRRDGADVVFDRLGSEPPFRLRVTKLTRESYEVVEEQSPDGGETWRRGELTRTRRIE